MIPTPYPYLVANLLALPLLAVAFLAAGRQRSAMLASGVIFTPWGGFSPWLDDYWSPARLGGFAIEIEDFVISFQTGAAAIGYTATYAVLFALLHAVLPQLAAEWRAGQWWTAPVAGLPRGELIWALAGAPAHMLCFAFIARADLYPPASAARP